MTDSQPRPGTARINGGPWLPCRFILDGRQGLIDWSTDLMVDRDSWPPLGAAEIEVAICDGVTVYGDVIVAEINARNFDADDAAAYGSGALRGVR